MRRRTVIFGVAGLLAIALAVPAFGGPSNPVADVTANAKKTAKKALKKAKKANEAAKAAQSSADAAQGTADTAQGTADTAVSDAAAAKSAADAAQATADTKFDDTTTNTGSTIGPNTVQSKLASAGCPSGQDLTGGGFSTTGTGGGDDGVQVVLDNAYINGWTVTVFNTEGAESWSVSATALCATN